MPETEIHQVEELSTKPSKLKRIKSNVIMAGIYSIPAVVIGGSIYASLKMGSMQLETAKINLEAAKLTKQ